MNFGPFSRTACQVTIAMVITAAFASAMDRAAAALRIAVDLQLKHTSDPKDLYGLFPNIFPGGYNGRLDVSLYREEATLENVVVALVRWTGWDVIHYDTQLIPKVKPYVSPKGFPYYAPDPTPRSIPYVIVALHNGLITPEALPRLRSVISYQQIDDLCEKVKQLVPQRPEVPPLILDNNGIQHLEQAVKNPGELVVLPTGFSQYNLIRDLPNRILDLNAPSLRLFDSSSGLNDGKQDYFPLGPLESQFSVGLRVGAESYVHQAEAIYGLVENQSSTVNAVGIWGSAQSMRKDARVWGGFIRAGSAEGPKQDAQLVGLEIDVSNSALPGVTPNRSKTGLQVVGIGNQPVTNAVEVIGAGRAKWSNGILFEGDSITPDGAAIALSEPKRLARGIDFSLTRFTDSALSLHQGSAIKFSNAIGNASTLYTDVFNGGHFVVRAGPAGFRIASNDDSHNLAVIDKTGNIITPRGSFDQLLSDVTMLKKRGIAPAPKTSHDRCEQGDMAEDTNYVYVCVTPNHWRRAQLSDWR